jgi:hypothetical protein
VTCQKTSVRDAAFVDAGAAPPRQRVASNAIRASTAPALRATRMDPVRLCPATGFGANALEAKLKAQRQKGNCAVIDLVFDLLYFGIDVLLERRVAE